MDASIFFDHSERLQLLCLAVAFTAAFIAGASYRRRNHPATAALPKTIVYRDAPTVRATGPSQRVDRIRKLVRLSAGESIDILPTPPGLPPRFRITVKSLSPGDAETAHLAIEFGGTQLSCGPLVTETAPNEFVLPRAMREEHRCSVFYYSERGDSLEFMRVKLRLVDPASGCAELDVMQLNGHWQSS